MVLIWTIVIKDITMGEYPFSKTIGGRSLWGFSYLTNILILLSLGKILRGKVVRTNLTIPKEYQVSFDVFLNSYPTTKGAIFRITNTTGSKGNQGDRIVRLIVNAQHHFLFHFSLGDDPNYSFETSFTMSEKIWYNVTVIQSNVSGTFKLQIFINDSMVHEVDNPSPNVFKEATAYASDLHFHPLDGFLTSLRILPGRFFYQS